MIEARGLTRRFGQFVAVEGVSLRVPDGAILALLGTERRGQDDDGADAGRAAGPE
jgi:ABC-2 type transport system ATP-binding protein